MFKRIIFALLYSKGEFYLSRNFRLQKVGNVNWLKNNFGFGKTCDFIDELIIININPNPTTDDFKKYFKDVKKLREKIFVPITLGGGVRTIDNAKQYFENGADKILINYLAHQGKPICEKISNIFGEQAISIMVDYKKSINGEIRTYIESGKIESKSLKKFIKSVIELKFGELILNSIDNDGTGSGIDLKCLNMIPKNFFRPVLLMGGAGKPEHFKNGLSHKKISGLITANLFNFLGTGLQQARDYSIKNKIKLVKFNKIEANV
ncbi:MAG: imidazole glycerol phosphate synthase cyclase subunit [Pelagibacteraceae bacterium]|jgi:imidazole glycerol-phosphate synthase subunit HisF|nr:imidazole glycerol phosphate synthase cyclase subunit [Pelagibacteraceae bacterium]